MKQVFEYMMHRTKNGIQTPEWVVDGDWFYHPENKTYLMIVDEDRNYYIPDSLTELSKDDVISRIIEINSITPIRIRTEEGKVDLQDSDIESYVDDWWSSNIEV
jgi:hypothetical protein